MPLILIAVNSEKFLLIRAIAIASFGSAFKNIARVKIFDRSGASLRDLAFGNKFQKLHESRGVLGHSANLPGV